MKNLKMFLMIGATVALLALPVTATNLIKASDNSVQDECAQANKDAWYAEFLKIRTTDQAKAFELAKKYLACPAAGEVTEAQQKIVDYLKKWATAYEEGMLKITFTDELYNKKNYPKAYEIGRQILAKEPDNLKVLVDLGANGYVLAPLKNAQLNAESVEHARKALQLIESGKTVEDWAPLAGKDAAVAYLNFTIGTQSVEKDPATSLKHVLRAAQLETPLKKSPFTYAYIAAAYETGAYAKQSEAYKTMYGGKDETPESKLALANINQIVDRMIDAYARAVALAGTDPQFATQKPLWLESLTTWYKYRNNNTDTGMNELIAGVLAKPLPPEPSPITVLPVSTPAATPTGTSGATPANGNGASGTTAPAGTTQPANKPATPAASPSPSPKPAGTKPATPDRPRR
ncbi:MAG: hypothetical protein LC794_09720 [Acidobacteria bacterium]|nr:hypothetical protein [Acidobacteriota bacterium]